MTRMNLDWGVEELILCNLVVIKMVWIGRVVQVAPLTSKRIPLNSQGAPLAPQGVPLAPRSIPRVEERVGPLTLVTGAQLLVLKGRPVEFVAVLVVPVTASSS